MRSRPLQMKGAVHVAEQGKNACWTLSPMEEGLLSVDGKYFEPG